MAAKVRVTALLSILIAGAWLPLQATPALAAGADTTWTQLTPGAPPYALVGGFAYDSAIDRALFFGGQNTDDFTLSSDLWAFDGQAWSKQPVSSPWPSARDFTQMAYDADRGRVVLFGGFGPGFQSLNDTWEWDGSSWTLAATSGPSPRGSGVMVYDSARKETLLFGGSTGSGPAGDTWAWNGSSWTQLRPATSPPARVLSGMAFDTGRGVAVLFGGFSSSGRLGDTWQWDGASWSNVSPSAAPSPRWGMALGYDQLKRRTVLFGGDAAPNDNQTWEWDGASWTRDLPSLSPLPSIYYQVTYDTKRQRIDMYGGEHEGSPNTYARDTWAMGSPLPIATSVKVAAATGDYGGTATLSATVAAADGSAVSGTVTFSAGGSTVTAPVDASGAATANLPLPSLAAGTYPVSATLTAGAGFLGSSGSGTLTVRQDQVSLGQGGSATTLSGDPLQLVVNVAGPPGTLPISEGSVTISDQDGEAVCAPLPVSSGSAACSIHPQSVGTHTYQVVYTGTANVAGQTGALTETVVPHNESNPGRA